MSSLLKSLSSGAQATPGVPVDVRAARHHALARRPALQRAPPTTHILAPPFSQCRRVLAAGLQHPQGGLGDEGECDDPDVS